MSDPVTASEIKRIRGKYDLTQQAFARLLGLGDASIVRYENGQTPTRSNSNLIRAADDPSFMLDCLERDGDLIAKDQYDKTERIIYSLVTLNEDGDVMDINQMYEITLQQEILNEQAAEYLGELSNLLYHDDELTDIQRLVYEDAFDQIARVKGLILEAEYSNKIKLAELRGQIEALIHFARVQSAKAA